MTADKARKTESKDTQKYLVVSYDKWTILLNLVSDEIRGDDLRARNSTLTESSSRALEICTLRGNFNAFSPIAQGA
jgi:hypothetical protein